MWGVSTFSLPLHSVGFVGPQMKKMGMQPIRMRVARIALGPICVYLILSPMKTAILATTVGLKIIKPAFRPNKEAKSKQNVGSKMQKTGFEPNKPKSKASKSKAPKTPASNSKQNPLQKPLAFLDNNVARMLSFPR